MDTSGRHQPQTLLVTFSRPSDAQTVRSARLLVIMILCTWLAAGQNKFSGGIQPVMMPSPVTASSCSSST